MQLPLRISITTAFVLFTTIAISIIASLNFIEGKDRILEAAKQRMDLSVILAESEVDKLINRAYNTSVSVALLPKSVFNPDTPEVLEAVMSASLNNAPEIYGVFVGFQDGSFLQAINLVSPDGSRRNTPNTPENATIGWRIIKPLAGTETRTETWRFFDSNNEEIHDYPNGVKIADYDPGVRNWYINARKEGHTIVSDAYVFASLRKPGITISKPIESVPGAVVGVDLPLTALAQLTKRIRPGKNGVVAIYNESGDIIAYPDAEKIIKNQIDNAQLELAKLSTIDDSRLHAAKAAQESNQLAEVNFSNDGNEYFGVFKQVGLNGYIKWRFVSVAAVSDFTENLITTLYHTLLVSLSILFFAMIVVAGLAGWIATPIIRIRDMADKITEMNLSPVLNFNSPFIEVISLQQSMERMRRALSIFIRYVPRELVRDLILSNQSVEIGGTRREISVMFSDIEGFTSMTEKMTPEEVMSQTSLYFEQLTFAIQANRGTIDKYIGDAIMAIWNAPADDPSHIDNACRGTLTAFSLSEELNKDLIAQGSQAMRTRFGLHTGEALVGNMGARDRMQYTCLGACVNLASRIEGLNKQYGTNILVSDAVRRKASRDFLFRRVDIVEAKGTSLPVTLYELMGERGEDAAFFIGTEQLKRASKYEEAFDFYLHREFSHASEILDALSKEAPEDGVVQSLKTRCEHYLKTPPPASWNGVTTISQK